ncbi:MAG: glycogen synthase GlgA [Bacillota bacterium]
MVASEMAPFAKVGGLADVVGSLPKALSNLGVDVRVVIPRYKKIEGSTYVTDFPVFMGNHLETAVLRRKNINGPKGDIPVYFIDNYRYFYRDYIYAGDDDAERFAFFSKAVLEMLPLIEFKPDVIHCNDWQTGMIPVILKERYAKQDDFYKGMGTLYTIHNLQYQGLFPKDILRLLDLGDEYFHPEALEFYGKVNFMKAGLMFADQLSTVSNTYAREIQTPEYGERLDGVLRKRSSDLHGIINGIDYEEFNPATDPRIAANYSSNDLSGKAACKKDLQEIMGLPKKDVPIIGLVSRLVDQKGLDLIGNIIHDLMKEDLQFVVLGTGDPRYEALFRNIGAEYPDKAGVRIMFDAVLAQKIYAGSDMFLMPSRFEPCGLGQLISMRYGTIPIVRKTGGLADTVEDNETGFVFGDYKHNELLRTITRALSAFRKHNWRRLVETAMGRDFSWEHSASVYLGLYRAIGRREDTENVA